MFPGEYRRPGARLGGTVAGVFVDLALGDVDQCRTIVMAVPWNDAAGFDHQLAKAKFAASDLRLLLPRSIEPRVVSVTPTALKSTGLRALGIRLSAGHSPAWAENAQAVVVPKTKAATVRSKTLLAE